MTKEEAIIQLRLGPGINEDVSEKYNDAVNMAIEALQTPPISQREMFQRGYAQGYDDGVDASKKKFADMLRDAIEANMEEVFLEWLKK